MGTGSFGTAYKVRDKHTSELLVMKQIQITDTDPGDLNNKISEIAVVKSYRHPFICRQRDHFIDNQRKILCILSEYCDRGDLEAYLKN